MIQQQCWATTHGHNTTYQSLWLVALLLATAQSFTARPFLSSRLLPSIRPYPAAPSVISTSDWLPSKTLLRASASDDTDSTRHKNNNNSNANVALDQALAVVKQNKNADLKNIIQLLQQHGNDIDWTKARFTAIFDALEQRTANEDMDQQEAAATTTPTSSTAVAEIPYSPARDELTQVYQLLRRSNKLHLFGAVPAHTLSQGSHTVSVARLQELSGRPLSALTPQPTSSWIITGVAVAATEAVLSLVLGISLNALFLTTLLLTALDRLLLNGAVLEGLLRVVRPELSAKIVRHEAGHFLLAYLLGCPVEGCVLTAWEALQDRRFQLGTRRSLSAGTSFFDPELSEQVNNKHRLTRQSVDRYSIIVMAGIAAEADCYGRADGGAGDETALVSFLSQLNNNNNNSNNKNAPAQWNTATIRNQARWAALQAMLLLRHYQPALDALVNTLQQGGKLGECVYAIEQAAQQHQLQPLRAPLMPLMNEEVEKKDNTTDTWGKTVGQESLSTSKDVLSDEAESLVKLSQYREEVQAKLLSIEEQIQRLQE